MWGWEGEAFGNTQPTGTVTINLRFPGQYYDAESGLHYNHHRYYDPKLCRYITSDPIGLHAGLNSYAYVFNNPLRFVDPTGLYTSARWLKKPSLSGVTAQADGDIGFAEYWTIIPPSIGLGGTWYMITASINGVVECIDEKDCKKKRDVFDVNVDLGKRVGIGYGLTLAPWVQAGRAALRAFEGVQDAITFYRNEWTQRAISMGNEPMTWCIIMSAGKNY